MGLPTVASRTIKHSDKCAKAERERRYEVCSRALRRSIEWLQPARVIGVGNFANEMTSLYASEEGFYSDASITEGIGPTSRAM